MDSKKRHELETNDLREFLDNFKDFWDKNGNSILITLIVVVGGYTAWNFYKKNKVEKVESAVMALSEATNGAYLMSVAEEHPSVRHIAWQRAGDAYLEEARAAAIKGEDGDVPKLLDSAASAYQRVVDDEDHAPEFRINALLGLATTAEMRDKWDEAKGFYDRAYDLAGDQFVRLAVLAQTGRDGLDDLRHPIAFGPDLPDNPADLGLPMDPNDLTGDGIPDLPGQTPGVDPLFPDGPILPDPVDGDSDTPTPGFDPLLQPNGDE